MGVLFVMVAASLFIDFLFFGYRLHQLGYLNSSFISSVFRKWAVIIPLAAAGGWALSYLFAWVIPAKMLLISIGLNGVSFTVLFLGLILLLDQEMRSQIKSLVKI